MLIQYCFKFARNSSSYNFRIFIHGKNDFAEKLKILLDTDLKIILLNYQNNFVRILKIISNTAKYFYILATGLNVLHNYFDNSTKLFFLSISS